MFLVDFAAASLLAGAASTPLATAQPYGNTPAEQQYLIEASTLFALRHPDKPILDVGYQACSIRRNGMSSDQAKVAVSKTLAGTYGMNVPGVVAGSLVHMAVDNLCPEVGYP